MQGISNVLICCLTVFLFNICPLIAVASPPSLSWNTLLGEFRQNSTIQNLTIPFDHIIHLPKPTQTISIDGVLCPNTLCSIRPFLLTLHTSKLSPGLHSLRRDFTHPISVRINGENPTPSKALATAVLISSAERLVKEQLLSRAFQFKALHCELEFVANHSNSPWDLYYNWHWPFSGRISGALQEIVRNGNGDQRVAHIPGSNQMTMKHTFCRGLHGFDFVPECLELSRQEKPVNFDYPVIYKPAISSKGRGIRIFTNSSEMWKHYENVLRDVESGKRKKKERSAIVSRYVENPLLVNGRKFDLRIYVVISGVYPFRAYVRHSSTLVRFASTKYQKLDQSNADTKLMHLTNTALNGNIGMLNLSNSSEESSNMWTFLQLTEHLQSEFGKTRNDLTQSLDEILRTVLVNFMQPMKSESTKYGFESLSHTFSDIFGFDIMFDSDFKPWLLEVNFHPNLKAHVDDRLRSGLKKPLIQEYLDLIGISTHVPQLYSEVYIAREFAKRHSLSICMNEQIIQMDNVPKAMPCLSLESILAIVEFERELERKGELELLLPSPLYLNKLNKQSLGNLDFILALWQVHRNSPPSLQVHHSESDQDTLSRVCFGLSASIFVCLYLWVQLRSHIRKSIDKEYSQWTIVPIKVD